MYSNHELQATLNSLGYLEDGQYYKTKDCLNAAKDLMRYLRRDDENQKPIRLELLKADIITNDLIPLIKIIENEEQLFDIILRLLVNLTQSAIICYDHKIPQDKLDRNVFIQIDHYLQKSKESFADETLIKVLCKKLNKILAKDWQNRPEEEESIIERILYLYRNILFIKTCNSSENDLLNSLNSHDKLIHAFHKAGLFETIIKLSSCKTESKYTVHLLEIITLIVREQNASQLAKANDCNFNKKTEEEKDQENKELMKLQMRDNELRRNNRLRLNPRHSRFAGTYVAVNMKAINDQNNIIYHKSNAKSYDDLLDDSNKKYTRKPKKFVASEENENKSASRIRHLLNEFCRNFLQNAYHTFMNHVYDYANRKKLEDDELCYYYGLIKFFTEFNRNSSDATELKCKRIRVTFGVELFHSIEIFIQRCIEMMRVEKKEMVLWINRMHKTLACYKELLYTLKMFENHLPKKKNTTDELFEIDNENLTCENEDILSAESSDLIEKLKNHIFYIQEFRELFITIFKDFDDTKMTKQMLRDLIEANHIYLEMLESYLKDNSEVSVQKKTKKIKRKGNKKNKQDDEEEGKLIPINEEEMKEQKLRIFDSIYDKLNDLTQTKFDDSSQVVPFDFATSNEEIDKQMEKVILRIQTLIKKENLKEAIILFRESRCIWPKKKELFGDESIQPNEEVEKLKELFLSDINEKSVNKNDTIETLKTDDKDKLSENEDCDKELDDASKHIIDETEDKEEDEEEQYTVKEEKLDFLKFLMRYTHPCVIKNYTKALADYETNTDFQNECCLCYFQRISNQCGFPQYLYQLSLFNTINKIYKNPLKKCFETTIKSNGQTIFEFFATLLSNFFEEYKKNQRVIVDLLFFKDRKLIFELTDEPEKSTSSKSRKKKSKNNGERDEKLHDNEDNENEFEKLLRMEFGENHEEPKGRVIKMNEKKKKSNKKKQTKKSKNTNDDDLFDDDNSDEVRSDSSDEINESFEDNESVNNNNNSNSKADRNLNELNDNFVADDRNSLDKNENEIVKNVDEIEESDEEKAVYDFNVKKKRNKRSKSDDELNIKKSKKKRKIIKDVDLDENSNSNELSQNNEKEFELQLEESFENEKEAQSPLKEYDINKNNDRNAADNDDEIVFAKSKKRVVMSINDDDSNE